MAVRNYYLPQSAETFIPALPEQYRAYHRAHQELSEEVKHTFMMSVITLPASTLFKMR